MWIVEIFKMSVDTSCDLLVYMTILWIVDFCNNEWINKMSILEFFVLWMDYFDTLVMYSFMLTLKPSSLKNLYFKISIRRKSPFNGGGTTFRGYTMRYKDVTNGLVATPALAVNTNTAFGTVSVAVVALRAYQQACCLWQVLCPINRKYWCCDWTISDVLVQHRVPPKGSVITAWSRLPTYTFSEIKFFFF